MKKDRVLYVTRAAAIAALYVVLTLISGMAGLSGGAVQVRLSEALTILPYFTLAAIPGLFIGCILGNALTGAALWDIIFGSLATLLGAILSRVLRKRKWLVPLPPILSNTLIIPLVLQKVYGIPHAYGFLALSVGLGEVLSCGVLGMILLHALEKHSAKLFS